MDVSLTDSSVPARTILVADDNPVNRMLTRVLLERYDPTLRILEAEDGSEALTLVYEQQPDLVFMDVNMPLMDGLEATRQLRAQETDRHQTVVALTGSLLPEDVSICLEAGMDDCLCKPVIRDQMYDLLDKYLNKK
jgi:CheY-like chemotaxis protein